MSRLLAKQRRKVARRIEDEWSLIADEHREKKKQEVGV